MTWSISLGVLATLLLVAPAPAFPISTATTTSPGAVSWAYGAERSFSATGTAADGNTTFNLHASYGWNTILTERNGSAGTLQVEVNRTVGASLFVTYCRPNCVAPTRSLNITEHVWESEIVFANLSASGTVYQNGTPTPAFALENTSVVQRGNLTESALAVINTLHGKATASEHFWANSQGSASVSFAPFLGLFPTTLGAAGWNSTAQYSASGSWSVSTACRSDSFFGVHSSATNVYPGGFSSARGTVALTGAVIGSQLLGNGLSTTQVGIVVTGPFTTWEGFILVPNQADLFSSNTAPWRARAADVQLASTQAIDVDGLAAVGHLPILASAARYQPSATDSGNVSLESGVAAAVGVGNPGAPPGSGPTDGPSAATIQAQPESPSLAQSNSNCLINTCGSGSGPTALVRGIAIGVVVAATVLAGAIVIVKRQPPRKEAPSRNARLYPQGTAVPPPSPPRTNGVGKAVPDSDASDPLGNLW
ncbi:MAG: hypothetical protein L3J95_00745 [Thermoplasmata archaeon]|nr:hypothetical protein [Thermoplasmata archaeon]MCI4358945.1 hypothetical protein [Thermoplasmata archaeon]